jgi:ABC-type polysaccharide transport system permease subunit
MLWNLLTKILVDLLVGLIVELAMAVIMSLFFQGRQERQTHSVSLA